MESYKKQFFLIIDILAHLVAGVLIFGILLGVALAAHFMIEFYNQFLEAGQVLAIHVVDYVIFAVDLMIFIAYLMLTAAHFLKETHHVLVEDLRTKGAE